MIDSAETVLPDPDSPTSATVSPLPMRKETPSTAFTMWPPERKCTDRLRISTRGAWSSMRSPKGFARVQRVAHALANEDEQAEQAGDRDEGGDAEPWRLQVGLALRQQFAERGGARRQAEAEEIQRRERRDRARQLEGKESERRYHRIGQEVLEHDLAVGKTKRARRGDVFKIAAAQELGAHDADQVDPMKQQQHAQQGPEAGHKNGGNDDQYEQGRDRRPDLEKALEDQIHPATEVTLRRARCDADEGRENGEQKPEQYRDAKAVDHPRQHIAALIVGAKPVAITDGMIARQLIGGRVAQLGTGRPGWRARKAQALARHILDAGIVLVDRIVRIADRRPDGPAVFAKLVEDHLVLVVGDSKETAKLRFGIIDKHGEQELALV